MKNPPLAPQGLTITHPKHGLEALNELDPIDRYMSALGHCEHLGRDEAARVLGISQEAGTKRYIRASKRLEELPGTVPGGGEGL